MKSKSKNNCCEELKSKLAILTFFIIWIAVSYYGLSGVANDAFDGYLINVIGLFIAGIVAFFIYGGD